MTIFPTVMLLKASSNVKQFDKFLLSMAVIKNDLAFIIESWLNSDTEDTLLFNENNNLLRELGRKGGGVCA